MLFRSFVSSDPDKMPSFKMTVGDMAMVMAKLSKLDDCLCQIPPPGIGQSQTAQESIARKTKRRVSIAGRGRLVSGSMVFTPSGIAPFTAQLVNSGT